MTHAITTCRAKCIYIPIWPVAHAPPCASPISKNAPFCNRNVHVCTFLLQNVALWDTCPMHCRWSLYGCLLHFEMRQSANQFSQSENGINRFRYVTPALNIWDLASTERENKLILFIYIVMHSSYSKHWRLKWLTLSRHFQIHFLGWNCSNFERNCIELWSCRCDQLNTCRGTGLVPPGNKPLITWASVDKAL